MLSFAGHCRIYHNRIARCFLHCTNKLDKLVQLNLSDIGEGIAEVQIKEWHVKVGEKIVEFDNLCEVQSDKAAVTITSRYDGVVKKLYYKVDDIARVGAPLVDIDVVDEIVATNVKSNKTDNLSTKQFDQQDLLSGQDGQQHSAAHLNKYLATPAVRRLIKEHGVQINKIKATGKNGRLLKEDILNHLSRSVQGVVVEAEKPKMTEDRVVKISGYTRAMIHSMSEALKIPHFGYNDEVNMNELIRLREILERDAQQRHLKLTFLPFIIKAVSVSLCEYPQLNACADKSQENMIYRAAHNITIAIDTPGGLAVPNIKHCEQKNVWEIAEELQRLQSAGKKQRIAREDLQDGTFTLSNIGIIGGTYASPVLLPPQIVIGALGRVRKLPRFNVDGNVVAASIMNVSWAADHRFVDGATLARFSNRFKAYVESPSTLAAVMR